MLYQTESYRTSNKYFTEQKKKENNETLVDVEIIADTHCLSSRRRDPTPTRAPRDCLQTEGKKWCYLNI